MGGCATKPKVLNPETGDEVPAPAPESAKVEAAAAPPTEAKEKEVVVTETETEKKVDGDNGNGGAGEGGDSVKEVVENDKEDEQELGIKRRSLSNLFKEVSFVCYNLILFV